MRTHYIPYNPTTKEKPLYWLALSSVAEYNRKTRRYDTINYQNLEKLASTINQKHTILSKATLSRLLNAGNPYFSWNKEAKTITLNNKYTSGADKRPFITVNTRELELLLGLDNFTIQYYLYLRHWYGTTKGQEIDNTRGQFLAAMGYPATSGAYLSRVSSANTELSRLGLIEIRASYEDGGHLRNYISVPWLTVPKGNGQA